uniref:Uncharacterized protein n=1 Tax=Cucumis melo TaxID=3656 RepID=A0A9I9EG60_CUCME
MDWGAGGVRRTRAIPFLFGLSLPSSSSPTFAIFVRMKKEKKNSGQQREPERAKKIAVTSTMSRNILCRGKPDHLACGMFNLTVWGKGWVMEGLGL